MDLKSRTAAQRRGMSDGFTLAVEFVVAPLVFALLGYWLDRRFGTAPVLAVALAVLAFVGVLIRTYYAYVAQMEFDERDKPWTRSRR